MKASLGTYPQSTSGRPAHGLSGPTDAGGEVRVLARGLQLLKTFCPRNRPLSNGDLASAARLPKPTVSRITATLTRLCYLDYLPDTAQYRLGHAALSLGFGVLSNLDIRVRARAHMQQFADENDLVVVLALRDGMSMLCHEVCRGRGALTIRVGVGSRLALPHSAMGRAWISSLPAPQCTQLLDDLAWDFPDAAHPSALEDAGVQIRQTGFCVTVSSLEPDVNSVATLVDFPRAIGHYVLGCSVPAFRYPPERCRDEIGPRLLALRGRIEVDQPAYAMRERL